MKNKLSYLTFFFTLSINFLVLKEKIYFLISLFRLKHLLNIAFNNIFPVYSFQNKSISDFQGKIVIFRNYYFSQFFLKDLMFFLLIQRKFNPKKIFNYLLILFKKKVNYSLVNISRRGICKKKLIGFKIKLKGKFEITKSSMSKKIMENYGKLKSTTLNSSVVFCEHTFFSKLGSSNIKI